MNRTTMKAPHKTVVSYRPKRMAVSTKSNKVIASASNAKYSFGSSDDKILSQSSTIVEKGHYLVIGHENGKSNRYKFGYSNGQTLREVLTSFCKAIDESEGKRDSQTFSTTLAGLTEGNSNADLAFALIESIFNYKVDFIGKIENMYKGKDFLTSILKAQNMINDPLPF